MQKSHLHLIKYSLNAGHKINVVESNEVLLLNSGKYTEVKDIVENLDSCTLQVMSRGEKLATFLIVMDSSFEPQEYVADYTVSEFSQEWEKSYSNGYCLI